MSNEKYAAQRRYRERNTDLIRQRWKEKYGPRQSAKIKLKRRNDPDWAAKQNERTRKWAAHHKDYLREFYRKKQTRLVRTNLNYAIAKRLRNRLGMALDGNAKSGKTVELLGCSIEDFKIYIESKFESCMTWDNWGKGEGKWNLDHIMPCAIFDLSKPEHQKRCFHFSNYQPLWETENIRKGSKSGNGQFQLI